MTELAGTPQPQGINIDEIIRPSIWHRSIHCFKLRQAREAMGLSQAEFARRAGHSREFQCQLEHPPIEGDCHEITLATAKAIEKVIDDR